MLAIKLSYRLTYKANESIESQSIRVQYITMHEYRYHILPNVFVMQCRKISVSKREVGCSNKSYKSGMCLRHPM